MSSLTFVLLIHIASLLLYIMLENFRAFTHTAISVLTFTTLS